MDDFLEQVAHRRKQGVYTILYIFCWMGVVVFGLFALLNVSTFAGMNEEGTGISFNWGGLIVGVIAAAIAFLGWRASDMCRVEYDYTFTNGTLDVSRVLNNRRRKYLTSLNLKDVIRCGPAAGPVFMKTLREQGMKTHNWFVNREANLYYFYFSKNNVKHTIVLELSDQMIELVRSKSYLQRGVWYEKDGQQHYGEGISR